MQSLKEAQDFDALFGFFEEVIERLFLDSFFIPATELILFYCSQK